MDLRGELRFIGLVERVGETDATIHIFPEFCAGLRGISDFSHLIILYWAHLRTGEEERRTLLVTPKRHSVNFEVGVFASRSPTRPNPICLCTVELLRVDGCYLTVRGLDAFEGSPIIDIKPYIPRADSIPDAQTPEWTNQGPKT
ncbi:MAG: tRNA (N6-threonylcarbamoyladenosine(37)-N6)-methyltransferase TrmO [Candidatus Bathyarchaeia archaeon]